MITAERANKETKESIDERAKFHLHLIEQIEEQIRKAIIKGRFETVLTRDNLPEAVDLLLKKNGFSVSISELHGIVIINWNI